MWGRRAGKTTTGECLLIESAVDGWPTAWFAPTFKYMMDAWRECRRMLGDAVVRVDSQERRIEVVGGGCIDFWSMDGPDPARGRKYKRVVLDECGIVRELMACWQEAIRPTLVDLKGDAWLFGTPKGRREFFQLWAKAESGDPEWSASRVATIDNPAIDPEEVDAARRSLPEQVFNQEFLGIPADDGGNPFGIKAIGECYARDAAPGPVAYYGVDLAKSQDWTVVIGLDGNGTEVSVDRWQHVPWNETAQRIARIIGDTPTLADSTGVGDPIVEQLQRMVPQVTGFPFTRQSKQKIMEGLAFAIQSTGLALKDPVMRLELEAFGYEYTANGVRYSAPDGLHDDTVCALALAVQLKTSAAIPCVSISGEPLPVEGENGLDYFRSDRGWESV